MTSKRRSRSTPLPPGRHKPEDVAFDMACVITSVLRRRPEAELRATAEVHEPATAEDGSAGPQGGTA